MPNQSIGFSRELKRSARKGLPWTKRFGAAGMGRGFTLRTA
jgi:hypothetical protein